MWGAEERRWRDAYEALTRVGLVGVASLPVTRLTYGQRRLLELARALNGRRSVLLLDEPSAGLNDAETSALCAVLLAVRSAGLPLLVVDHKIDFLTELCDRVAVLQLGEVIAEGLPQIVWQDERVRSAYLGE
jgi:branched-chain amino acid transport system ATP-binding protein